MITRKILIVFIFFFVSLQNTYSQEDSIHLNLRTIEVLYNNGSYLNAELEARRLLEYKTLNDSNRVAAHKNIAFSLIAQGKTELAKEQFISILKLVPEYDLDPVYTSPKILVIFRETQRQFMSARKNHKDNIKDQILVEQNGHTYRTIVFPGWEQLHQSRSATGYVFLGTGIATLGAGITFEFLRSSARQNYLSETNSSEINKKYDVYNRYYKAEVFSFIAFAAVYLASEIDVLRSQQDLSISIDSNSSNHMGASLIFAFRF